jgi:hypothetical protein
LPPAALLPLLALLTALSAAAGEALPPGPPWHTDWRAAKQEALTEGRPIFAYFTKRY